MKLPKELTTVTPLSKYLALLLFILLPIVAFFLGAAYQEKLDSSKNFPQEKNYQFSPQITSVPPSEVTSPPPTITPTKIFTPVDTIGTPGPRQKEEGLPSPN